MKEDNHSALITCSKCNATISDKAKFCPNCGAKNNILSSNEKQISDNGITKPQRSLFDWFLFAYKKFFVFKGRATRIEFWSFMLFATIITLCFDVIIFLIFKNDMDTYVLIIDIFYCLFILPPTLAVSVRRIHDIGKSGLWVFVPIINFIFYLQDSVDDNRYGKNLK